MMEVKDPKELNTLGPGYFRTLIKTRSGCVILNQTIRYRTSKLGNMLFKWHHKTNIFIMRQVCRFMFVNGVCFSKELTFHPDKLGNRPVYVFRYHVRGRQLYRETAPWLTGGETS